MVGLDVHHRTGRRPINTLGGWRADPAIVVEGIFDALSLASCGLASIATIGRWVPWLSEAFAGRTVWLAMDQGRGKRGHSLSRTFVSVSIEAAVAAWAQQRLECRPGESWADRTGILAGGQLASS